MITKLADRVRRTLFIGVALMSGCLDTFGVESGEADTTGTTGTGAGHDASSTQLPTTGAGPGTLVCTDADGDSFGDPTMCFEVPGGEVIPDGVVENAEDCDDASASTFPGVAPKDDPNACMKDADGDDFGDSEPANTGIAAGTDCDDDDAVTFPGAAPADDPIACMRDADGDNRGDGDPPADGVVAGSDCDDGNQYAWVHCDTCVDVDGDGWYVLCDQLPENFPGVDCDDMDKFTFPGAAPKDDVSACLTDADEDDYGDDTPAAPSAVSGTDCDDDDADTYPGSAPKDSSSACMTDGDGDGHGAASPSNPAVSPGDDCDDEHAGINPTDSRLITAQNNTSEIMDIDIGTGTLTAIATLDTTGFTPWIPTSVAIDPNSRDVVAALGLKPRLVTINYCGEGKPTAFPAAHNRMLLCAIGYGADGKLWGVDGVADELILFAEDGSIASATELTIDGTLTLNIGDCGMTWDCHEGRLLLSDTTTDAVYSVDVETAIATKIAEVADDDIGSGLAYEPVSKQVLSSFGSAFYLIAIDGSNTFTKLADLMANGEVVDDLEYAPGCN